MAGGDSRAHTLCRSVPSAVSTRNVMEQMATHSVARAGSTSSIHELGDTDAQAPPWTC